MFTKIQSDISTVVETDVLKRMYAIETIDKYFENIYILQNSTIHVKCKFI